MDILDEDDITSDPEDLDFDVNTSAIKPTSSRTTITTKDDDSELEELEDDESLDDLKARELEDLEEDENYLFNMDELEQ